MYLHSSRGMYSLISPAVKVSSLSSAASKSYRARTFLASTEEEGPPETRLVEGYRVLWTLGECCVSFRDNSMAEKFNTAKFWRRYFKNTVF